MQELFRFVVLTLRMEFHDLQTFVRMMVIKGYICNFNVYKDNKSYDFSNQLILFKPELNINHKQQRNILKTISKEITLREKLKYFKY